MRVSIHFLCFTLLATTPDQVDFSCTETTRHLFKQFNTAQEEAFSLSVYTTNSCFTSLLFEGCLESVMAYSGSCHDAHTELHETQLTTQHQQTCILPVKDLPFLICDLGVGIRYWATFQNYLCYTNVLILIFKRKPCLYR